LLEQDRKQELAGESHRSERYNTRVNLLGTEAGPWGRDKTIEENQNPSQHHYSVWQEEKEL